MSAQANFFQGITDADQARSIFRELVKKHHPDVGGDLATMQAINAQYHNVLRGNFTQNTTQSRPQPQASSQHGYSRNPYDGLSAEQVLSMIGFEIERQPLFYDHGYGKKQSSRYAIIRKDSGAELGIVSDQYKIITHREVLEPAIEALDGMGFKFKQVKLKDQGASLVIDAVGEDVIQVNGEAHKPRILIVNSYDTTKSLQVHFGMYRLICTNGMIAPVSKDSGISIPKIKHVGNIAGVVGGWKNAIQDSQWIDDYKKQLESFNRALPQWRAVELLAATFGVEAKSAMNNRNVVDSLRLARYGKGQNGELTGWSLYNGVTELVQKSVNRGKDDSAQATRLMSSTDRITKFHGLLTKAF